MIRVTYPNEGQYVDGRPRYEIVNAKGEITFCRQATPEEATAFELISAMGELRFALDCNAEKLRDLATYGLPVQAPRR